jgi:hypothetical protein
MTAESSRRVFLKRGLIGSLLLAAGGGAWIALRPGLRGVAVPGLRVLDDEEAAIFAAVAAAVLGVESRDPSPARVGVVARSDALLFRAGPSDQRDFRRLLRLFENAWIGVLARTGPVTFTRSGPEARRARLAAWERSRVPLFRTGFQAMKRLASAAYYSSPEAWPAIGYPGPPDLLPAP